MLIGVISDTHGQIDPRARAALRGVEHILHAGDVGDPAVLARLAAPRPAVYIFGHSHVALHEVVDGVLFLNPGAAGRPRFGGGLSVALLEVADGRASAQIVPLT